MHAHTLGFFRFKGSITLPYVVAYRGMELRPLKSSYKASKCVVDASSGTTEMLCEYVLVLYFSYMNESFTYSFKKNINKEDKKQTHCVLLCSDRKQQAQVWSSGFMSICIAPEASPAAGGVGVVRGGVLPKADSILQG